MTNQRIIIMDFATCEVHVFIYDPNIWESGKAFLIAHFSEQGETFKESQCQWMVVDLEKTEDKLLPDLRKKQETLENHYLSTPNSLVDTSRMKLDNHPDLKGKQETIEEVAFKHTRGKPFKEMPSQMDFINGAVFGAKWQAERMYSEEESIQKIIDYVDFQFNTKGELNLEIKKWFEQFKKK